MASERLVEEAGEAIRAEMARYGYNVHITVRGEEIARVLAAAALAVFEAAQAPTEDEREALETAIWDALEPRVDDVIDLDLNEPSDNAVFSILVGQVADAVAGFRRPVQGEPTDAQVLAALNNYEAWSAEETLDMWGTDQVARMRAALRAAGVTAVQGEGRREYTAAYRAKNGNVIPLGDETVRRADAERVRDEFATEDPTGPEYFIATRVLPPWLPMEQEGDR